MGESFFWKDKNKGILKADLFAATANEAAKRVASEDKKCDSYTQQQGFRSVRDRNGASEDKKCNSYTQLRKFYDEVLRYKTKISANEEDFEKYLPYIRMINAKFAYSKARGHITVSCCNFFQGLINQIADKEDFYVFADFFEAFMAFYRQYRQK